jgi:enoyl-[acyl-carrier protein] reductase II
MFVIAQFGAATESIMAATVDGDVNSGVQFIGQSQGLIHDIPTVEEVVQRIVKEAIEVSQKQQNTFRDGANINLYK